MEMMGTFLDEEWESLSQIFSSGESHDFSLQHCHGSSSYEELPSPTFFPSHQYSCISQESSNTTAEIEEALFLNVQENEDHQHHNFNDAMSMSNFHGMDFNNAGFMLSDAVIEEFLRSKVENRPLEAADSCQIKRKSEASDVEMMDLEKSEDHAPQNPKKKPRFSRNAKKNKTVQPKKGKKTMQEKDNEEENNGGNKQSCSSLSSEDDSNASQELNEEIENSNTKTKASRGSATDPQSLYARKRRERINERLKILQNLVPNGTKVDISTMLEEAVQYVKFLQLQIKLLSSDNLWMYAPLAYNGMDIGMYQKICPNLRQ